jgi:hypothetical protein
VSIFLSLIISQNLNSSASSLEISLMLETEHFMLRAEDVSEDLGMVQAWDHTELSHQESLNPI